MVKLTQNLLKELFDYRDGELYWKVRKAKNTKIGDRAGWLCWNGYRQASINGKNYFTHRLIFLFHHGRLPKEIDHIDGDPSNNTISNLRVATRQENHMNQKKSKSYNGKPTSSKYKGVSWNKEKQKWTAHIGIDGKLRHLGYFRSEIKAAKAYDKVAIEAFGEFVNPNFDYNIG